MKKNEPSETAAASSERHEEVPLSLGKRLGLIGLIDEGMRLGSSDAPMMADLFKELWDLVHATVSGSKIDRLRPEDSLNGFRVFEINAENGENLGRLNMLYLKKPIPCYYLVYVEVSAPFRRKGLGHRILEFFRDFLIEKSAVGVLDNIIPREDPTYDIYFKQAWEAVEDIIGDGILDPADNYMIFIPPALQRRNLRERITKLIYHIKRKRAAIDMRDNEMMVQRTIAEFRELYQALLTYFEPELRQKANTPVMRFMFTRFVTKLIAFRRRIGDLIGYTGGDSLEQIALGPEIAALPVQSYAPTDLSQSPSLVSGDAGLWGRLPDALREHPARFIEALPNYRRPNLLAWLKERGLSEDRTLTLGDLMDLGFDPTRLKEIVLEGQTFVFERIQARQLPDLEEKERILEKVDASFPMGPIHNTDLRTNPPLVVIRDRGNAYVLRRKIEGIHWEEAVEQLLSAPALTELNRSLKLDRMIKAVVRQVGESVAKALGEPEETLLDRMACFVSWDMENNQPKLMIDFTTASLRALWLA